MARGRPLGRQGRAAVALCGRRALARAARVWAPVREPRSGGTSEPRVAPTRHARICARAHTRVQYRAYPSVHGVMSGKWHATRIGVLKEQPRRASGAAETWSGSHDHGDRGCRVFSLRAAPAPRAMLGPAEAWHTLSDLACRVADGEGSELRQGGPARRHPSLRQPSRGRAKEFEFGLRTKSPHLRTKRPHLRTKHPHLRTKHPHLRTKRPHALTKRPHPQLTQTL